MLVKHSKATKEREMSKGKGDNRQESEWPIIILSLLFIGGMLDSSLGSGYFEGTLFCVASFLVIWLGVQGFWRNFRGMHCGQKMVAEVVGHKVIRGAGRPYYTPIMELQTTSGDKMRCEGARVSGSKSPPKGSRVKVWYILESEYGCLIMDVRSWLVPLLYFTVGSLILWFVINKFFLK